jgi:hypothetical protein
MRRRIRRGPADQSTGVEANESPRRAPRRSVSPRRDPWSSSRRSLAAPGRSEERLGEARDRAPSPAGALTQSVAPTAGSEEPLDGARLRDRAPRVTSRAPWSLHVPPKGRAVIPRRSISRSESTPPDMRAASKLRRASGQGASRTRCPRVSPSMFAGSIPRTRRSEVTAVASASELVGTSRPRCSPLTSTPKSRCSWFPSRLPRTRCEPCSAARR